MVSSHDRPKELSRVSFFFETFKQEGHVFTKVTVQRTTVNSLDDIGKRTPTAGEAESLKNLN